MSKVFVFRIANDSEYVKKELKQGRLRQGWGGKNASIELSLQEWLENKCKDDNSEDNINYYRRKYNNLKIMLTIEPDDVIIIPKTPSYSQFTICKASGNYVFKEAIGFDGDDFQHLIPVKDIKVFNYHANEKCEIVRAKMRGFQSPVNNVWNETFFNVAVELSESEQASDGVEIEEIVKEIKHDLFNEEIKNRFRDLGNRQIEKITKSIFEKIGYEFKFANHYDKKGGDADLVFSDNSFSELMDVGVNSTEISGDIYIQVKNKHGKDSDDIKGARQLVEITDGVTNATKILISTVDEFSKECIEYSNNHEILLIDGNGFLNLVFKYLN